MNSQLKKGVCDIIVLEFLKESNYGYAISEYMNRFIDIKLTSVYGILVRLEQKGYLSSQNALQGKNIVKNYQVNDAGLEYLQDLYSQWQEITNFINYTKEQNEKN